MTRQKKRRATTVTTYEVQVLLGRHKNTNGYGACDKTQHPLPVCATNAETNEFDQMKAIRKHSTVRMFSFWLNLSVLRSSLLDRQP